MCSQQLLDSLVGVIHKLQRLLCNTCSIGILVLGARLQVVPSTVRLNCVVLLQNSMYGWSEFLKEMKGFYQVGGSTAEWAEGAPELHCSGTACHVALSLFPSLCHTLFHSLAPNITQGSTCSVLI